MPMARMRPSSLVVPAGGKERAVQSPAAAHCERVGHVVALGWTAPALGSGNASRRTYRTGLFVTLSKRRSHPSTASPAAEEGTSMLKYCHNPTGLFVRVSGTLSKMGCAWISRVLSVKVPSLFVGL